MEDITKPISRKTGSLITKNLIILIVLVVVCILLIWAWFTSRQDADASGINIKSSADGVQVSWDKENWYNDLTALNESDIVEGITGMAKNISGKNGVPEPLNLITGNGLKFFEPLLNRKTGEVLVDSNGAWQGIDIASSNSQGKYIDIDLYFRSTSGKDVYLAGDSFVSPKDTTQRFSEYGPFSKDYIAAASRVAFLNSDKIKCSFIWAPNADIELVETDAGYTKYTTTDESGNYSVPENSSCVLASPDFGVALSSGQNLKKTINFTSDTRNSILPVSVTMKEQFIAEKTEGEAPGTEDPPSSEGLIGTAVGNSARVEIENATSKNAITENNNGTLTSLASGGKYYYIGSYGKAYVPFYVEKTGYYSLDVITASNTDAKKLRTLICTSTSTNNAVLNKIITSPKTENQYWETVSVSDSILLQAGTQYYVAAETSWDTGYNISVDAFDITLKGGVLTSVMWEGSLDLANWGGYLRFSAEDMANINVGDIIRLTVADATSGAQVTIQDANWGNINDFGYPMVDTKPTADFVITESVLNTVKNGIIVKGTNAKLVKIELITSTGSTFDTPTETYKFKNKNTNTYLNITNGTVTLSETGSDFTLCHFPEFDGPVLKSGDYYLVIQNGEIAAVKKSDLNFGESVTVYTGGSYYLNTGLPNDSQSYSYYDSEKSSMVTLGASSTPKLFSSMPTDPETELIGNTKIVSLIKESDADEYYTAHVVMRIWVEGTDRDAKTPLADGIFDASLHFVTQ